MILVFDVGNTETTIGLFEGETLRAHWRITTDATRTPDEIALTLRALVLGRVQWPVQCHRLLHEVFAQHIGQALTQRLHATAAHRAPLGDQLAVVPDPAVAVGHRQRRGRLLRSRHSRFSPCG